MTGPHTPRSIVVSMGDPAGIGPELALQAWQHERASLPPFALLADGAHLAGLARRIGLADLPLQPVESPDQVNRTFATALPVLTCPLARPATPGTPDPANGAAVVEAIRRGAAYCLSGEARALVTLPIHKKTLYDAGFGFPGHTEYLGQLCGGKPVMLLVGGGLRVAPVTIHLALRQVADSLRQADIVHAGRVVAEALRRDFAIAEPRLAVAGLNPHAGEDGALGDEERRIIAPAVAALAAEGWQVSGPWPADSLFHEAARERYDAVLTMYHDQALIPLKTLDFYGGVNTTLGIGIVRTSPDHGTAFDIAGRAIAHRGSLVAALRLAADMARARAAQPAPAAAP